MDDGRRSTSLPAAVLAVGLLIASGLAAWGGEVGLMIAVAVLAIAILVVDGLRRGRPGQEGVLLAASVVAAAGLVALFRPDALAGLIPILGVGGAALFVGGRGEAGEP